MDEKDFKFEEVPTEPDVGGQKMWKRLNWGVQMVERISEQKFKDMPMELKIKSLEVGISLYINSERR